MVPILMDDLLFNKVNRGKCHPRKYIVEKEQES
jgi:hypothetical protein